MSSKFPMYIGSNVRAVVTDRKTAAGDVQVLTASNYYPFGMLQAGNSLSSKDYRFGFNGKEMDNDLGHGTGNMYDYGFRIYNPRIAKFLSVDPLMKSYPMLTPYQFASNTPIWAKDLDGLEAVIYIRDADWAAIIEGKYTAHMTEGRYTSEDIQKTVVKATYATIDRSNPQNAGRDPENNWAAVNGPDGSHLGTYVYYNGALIAQTSYYNGERVNSQMNYKGFMPNYLPNSNAPINAQIRSLVLNDIAKPIGLTWAGTVAGGLMGIASPTVGVLGSGILGFTQDAVEQNILSEGQNWDVYNSLINGTFSALTFNKKLPILQKYAVNAAGDFLKSAIDFDLTLFDTQKVNPQTNFNSSGLIDFGLRSTVGNGFRLLGSKKILDGDLKTTTGASDKQVRSIITKSIKHD